MNPKGNWRAPWHDYRLKAKYMITLKKSVDVPSFGEISLSSQDGSLLLSNTGTIVKNTLPYLHTVCEDIRLWQYIVMPDHIHILIKVEKELDEPLGNYIARLKTETNRRCGIQIYDPGFNDQIITPQRSLDAIFKYIKDNPRRLAVRLANPEYFRRVNEVMIAGKKCQVYGNLQLLYNPFKKQVVCHRKDTHAVKERNIIHCLYNAANGGVLVSPFISRDEKAIRKAAEAMDGKIILISNHKLGEREKPAVHDFELCEQGRMLIIMPHDIPETGDRVSFMAMNDFAATLAVPRPF